MAAQVIRAGLLTTVQDLGRYGAQRFGVPVSGAMDRYSLRVANRLVGNADRAAALEITLVGPVLQFDSDTLIALCGGDLDAVVGDKPLPMNRPVWIARGSRLAFGQCLTGCRAYLALAGGVDVPEVLGSRSTYLRAGFGGLQGRALKAGDRIELIGVSESYFPGLRESQAFSDEGFAAPNWSVRVDAERLMLQPQRVRFVAGRHWQHLPSGVRKRFVGENFRVGAASDRMGYRLEGVDLDKHGFGDIASEAVAFGTIQLPPDGNPIVLMADRQTIGGYPRVGEVASVDLPLLAQLKPGDTLRFERIGLGEAQRLFHLQRSALAQIGTSIMAAGSQ
ncbi:MAG: biotin-dependent carboxyltransferase family protein [Betaproteobacteria bacterium]|nr:MAG: biotin-dependent carboxyltransferase family protein [Betaproteobacteria bacterium]